MLKTRPHKVKVGRPTATSRADEITKRGRASLGKEYHEYALSFVLHGAETCRDKQGGSCCESLQQIFSIKFTLMALIIVNITA